LRQRLKNSWRLLRKRKFGEAVYAIFDKQTSEPSAGVDYGHFPKEEILQIIRTYPQYCDAKLLKLATWAERSRYDRAMEGGNDELFTSAEFEFFNHIYDEYGKLARKFVGGNS
jgi:hypothetical protein